MEHRLVKVDLEPDALREARRRWAELLRRIFEVEPLACPLCGQTMCIVAFITEPKVIDRLPGPSDAIHPPSYRLCSSSSLKF